MARVCSPFKSMFLTRKLRTRTRDASNHNIQRTALLAAADAERYTRLARRQVLDVECRQGKVKTMQFTAVFEKVPEGYIAFVEELPGANTQGATLEEARNNLQEAVELVLEANRVLAEETLNGRAVIREPFVIVSK